MANDGAFQGGDSGRPQSSNLFGVTQADPQPVPEPSAHETADPPETAASAAHDPELHVLVVDDHRAIRRALCRLLEMAGYHPHEADCVAAARDKLRDRRFDIVLLDIDMPGERGTALL